MCIGQAASMGSLLLAAGAAGKRFCLPNARIMIHQPLGRLPGPGDRHRDPGRARSCDARDRLNEIYATHTGQDLSVIVSQPWSATSS